MAMLRSFVNDLLVSGSGIRRRFAFDWKVLLDFGHRRARVICTVSRTEEVKIRYMDQVSHMKLRVINTTIVLRTT